MTLPLSVRRRQVLYDLEHTYDEAMLSTPHGSNAADGLIRRLASLEYDHMPSEEDVYFPALKVGRGRGGAMRPTRSATTKSRMQRSRRLFDSSGDDAQRRAPEALPHPQRAAPPEVLSKLYDDLVAAWKWAPTTSHPAAPDKPLPSKLTHPLAGALDRVVDAATGKVRHTVP
jgi:hypothetical protein